MCHFQMREDASGMFECVRSTISRMNLCYGYRTIFVRLPLYVYDDAYADSDDGLIKKCEWMRSNGVYAAECWWRRESLFCVVSRSTLTLGEIRVGTLSPFIVLERHPVIIAIVCK